MKTVQVISTQLNLAIQTSDLTKLHRIEGMLYKAYSHGRIGIEAFDDFMCTLLSVKE